jgi:hypothetical protein
MEKMSVEIVKRPLLAARSHAGGIVLLALGCGFLGFGLWLRGLPSFVAWQLAHDHFHGIAAHTGSRILSSEPAVVAAWLERHGTPVPPLPDHAGSAALVGAHYCSLFDRLAAHIVYQGEDTSVSVFVLYGPLRARNFWSASVRGTHVHFVHAVGRVIAIVGEREDDASAALRAFARSVADASSASASTSPRG